MTMIDEPCYYDARTTETERLYPVVLDPTPDYLPRNPLPLTLLAVTLACVLAYAALWRVSLYAAGFSAGWAARELAGSVWDHRGWGALLVFAIVGATVIVHGRNRTYTYPEVP